jgi:hypothetical protein
MLFGYDVTQVVRIRQMAGNLAGNAQQTAIGLNILLF